MKLLKNMKLRNQILMFIVVMVVLFGGLVGFSIPTINNTLNDQAISKLKNLVETSCSTIEMYYDRAQKGLISEDDAKEMAMEDIRSLRYEGDNYYWINDSTPVMIMHPIQAELEGQDLNDYKDPNGTRIFVEFVNIVNTEGEGSLSYEWPKPGEEKPSPKISYVKGFKPWGWIIGSGIYVDDLSRIKTNLLTQITIIMSVILVLGFILAFLIARSITTPINMVLDYTKKLARGDLRTKLEYYSTNEVGIMADSLREMLNGVIGSGESIKKGITDPFITVNKDLTVTYMNESCAGICGYSYEEAVGKMTCKDMLNTSICETNCIIKKAMAEEKTFTGVRVKIKNRNGKEIPVAASVGPLRDLEGVIMGGLVILRDLSKEYGIQRKVEEITEQLTSSSDEIASSSEEMAAGAEQQARQTGEVATAIEEMSQTILETSKNTEDLLKTVRNADSAASSGGQVLEKTIDSIKEVASSSREIARVLNELSGQSEQIGQIVSVIDDIADQTNLLALNAAIEAARAGEHGRGFAVVADEVRKLAERTLKTTKEVTSTVKAIQAGTRDTEEVVDNYSKKSEEAVQKANEARESFKNILTESQKVTDISQQVATAAGEQSSAAEQISKNIESVAFVAKQVTAGTQQSAAACQQLNKLAKELADAVAMLN
ncbi:MAG: cache domain-containing protein [Actinobacteria bacterium]|nr:cache domain-containing protein [Actinomycetota bacterium]